MTAKAATRAREPGEITSVRVFLSSTFVDTQSERDALVKQVLPELNSRLRAHAVQVVLVDLRWGVSAEESQPEAIQLTCLNEIDNSRVVTAAKPWFLGLRTARYGWVQERYNASTEFEHPARFQWLDDLAATGSKVSITSLEVMHGALNAEGSGSDHLFFYMRDPAFAEALAPEDKWVFDFEYASSAEAVPPGVALQYKVTPQAATFRADLDALNARIRGLGEEGRATVRDYSVAHPECHTTGELPSGKRFGVGRVQGLEAFTEQVLDDLYTALAAEYPAVEAPASGTDLERHLHRSYTRQNTRTPVQRDAPLSGVLGDYAHADAFQRDETCVPLVLHGEPGIGKSALLAGFAQACRAAPGLVCIEHFVGASAASFDLVAMLQRLTEEFARAVRDVLPAEAPAATKGPIRGGADANASLAEDLAAGATSTEAPTLAHRFGQLLVRANDALQNAGRTVVFVLDGVDQLSSRHQALLCNWVPATLPARVRMVLSSAPTETLSALLSHSPKPEELHVPALAAGDSATIARRFLDVFHKKLTETDGDTLLGNQMQALVAKDGATSPLYVVTTSSVLLQFGVYEKLTGYLESLPGSFSEMFTHVLEGLEAEHGRELVAAFMALIAVSRAGLLESELQAVVDARIEYAEPPKSNFARLFGSARAFVTSGGGGLLRFFHGRLGAQVLDRYAPHARDQAAYHAHLRDHFRSLADPTADATWVGAAARTNAAAPRALAELGFHTARAGPDGAAELWALLGSVGWLEAKLAATGWTSLLQDFEFLHGPPPGSALDMLLQALRFASRAVAADPAQFLAQLVHRLRPVAVRKTHPAITNLVADAVDRLEALGRPWLGPFSSDLGVPNRLHTPAGSSVSSFTHHTSQIQDVQLNDGLIMSCGLDGRVLVLRQSTGILEHDLKRPPSIGPFRKLSPGAGAAAGSAPLSREVHAARRARLESGPADPLAAHPAMLALQHFFRVQHGDLDARADAASSAHEKSVRQMALRHDKAVSTIQDSLGRLNAGAGGKAASQSLRLSLDRQLTSHKRSLDVLQAQYTKRTDGFAAKRLKLQQDEAKEVAATRALIAAGRSVPDIKLRRWQQARPKGDAGAGGLGGAKSPGVYSLAYDARHRTLLAGDAEGVVTAWSLQTGTIVQVLEGHVAAVRRMAHVGAHLVTASHDGAIHLWAVGPEGGYAFERKLSAGGAVASMGAWPTPDGRGSVLVVGRSDGAVAAFHLPTGAPLSQLCAPTLRSVRCLAVSRDGRFFASGGEDHVVTLWNAATLKSLVKIPFHSNIKALGFSPDASLLLCSTEGGRPELHAYHLQRGKLVLSAPTEGNVNGISCSGGHAILSSTNLSVSLHGLSMLLSAEGRASAPRVVYEPIVDVAACGDGGRGGSFLVRAARTGPAAVFDLTTNQVLAIPGKAIITQVATVPRQCPGWRTVLVSSFSNLAVVLDERHREIYTMGARDAGLPSFTHMAVCGPGLVCFLGPGKQFHLVGIEPLQQLGTIDGRPAGTVNAMVASAVSGRLAVAANTVALFDVAARAKVGDLPLAKRTQVCHSLLFSPDGATVFGGLGRGNIVAWSSATLQLLFTVAAAHDGMVAALFGFASPSGWLLCSGAGARSSIFGARDTSVRVWGPSGEGQVQGLTCLTRFSVDAPVACGVDVGGGRMAVGGLDGAVHLFELTPGGGRPSRKLHRVGASDATPPEARYAVAGLETCWPPPGREVAAGAGTAAEPGQGAPEVVQPGSNSNTGGGGGDGARKLGWLTKLGAVVRNWKRRYFVLTDTTLSYFENPQSARPKGVIDMSLARVEPNSKKPNAFGVSTPSRIYVFVAENPEERAAWMQAINDATLSHC